MSRQRRPAFLAERRVNLRFNDGQGGRILWLSQGGNTTLFLVPREDAERPRSTFTPSD